MLFLFKLHRMATAVPLLLLLLLLPCGVKRSEAAKLSWSRWYCGESTAWYCREMETVASVGRGAQYGAAPPSRRVGQSSCVARPGATQLHSKQTECKRRFQGVVSATSHQRGELLQMKIGDKLKTILTVEATQCCWFDKRGSRQGARASEYLPCVPGKPQ